MIRNLHPKNYAALIAADHSKCDEASTKRDRRGAEPGIGADRLPQERVAQDLQELSKRVQLRDQMVLGRKKVRLPHHRRDKEQDHQPCGYYLNDIAIAYACHGDDVSQPDHSNPGESECWHDLQKIPVTREAEGED